MSYLKLHEAEAKKIMAERGFPADRLIYHVAPSGAYLDMDDQPTCYDAQVTVCWPNGSVIAELTTLVSVEEERQYEKFLAHNAYMRENAWDG
jgi:hypothetical protein